VKSKLRLIEAKSAYSVYIYNSNKILQIIVPSVNTLAKLINSNHLTIVNYIKMKIYLEVIGIFSNLLFKL
jgi:hypothetical protein